MFNFIRKLFHLAPKNIPSKPSPLTPKSGQEKGEKKEEDKNNKQGELIQDQATLNALALVNQRLDSNDALMKGIVVALLISFIVLLFGYYQFASTSLNDYSQKVKELIDQKFQFQQGQIDFLIKIATSEAK